MSRNQECATTSIITTNTDSAKVGREQSQLENLYVLNKTVCKLFLSEYSGYFSTSKIHTKSLLQDHYWYFSDISYQEILPFKMAINYDFL